MPTKTAWLAIPSKPVQRWRLFSDGLRNLGYHIARPERSFRKYGDDDILVLWNRTERDNQWLQSTMEGLPIPVFVGEQPYLRNDSAGNRYYALALDGHNGAGRWPDTQGERWKRMHIELKPWQDGGDWILVCLQRGIGAPGMAMPKGWGNRIYDELRQVCRLHIEVRKPPSRTYGQEPLGVALKHARAVVVWTSNVATQALLAGVPAFYCGPYHICGPSLSKDLTLLENPPLLPRLLAFDRLADAQWTEQEIESGEAFKRLLEMAQ